MKKEKGASIDRETLIAELVWGKTMETIEQKESTIDQECILENALKVARSVRDVIKRPKEGRMTPGGRLRIACIRSGLTQKVFADKIGISLSSLTTLMTNRSPVSRPVALAVELVHRFNAEWILTGGGLIHGGNLASGSWGQHGQ